MSRIEWGLYFLAMLSLLLCGMSLWLAFQYASEAAQLSDGFYRDSSVLNLNASRLWAQIFGTFLSVIVLVSAFIRYSSDLRATKKDRVIERIEKYVTDRSSTISSDFLTEGLSINSTDLVLRKVDSLFEWLAPFLSNAQSYEDLELRIKSFIDKKNEFREDTYIRYLLRICQYSSGRQAPKANTQYFSYGEKKYLFTDSIWDVVSPKEKLLLFIFCIYGQTDSEHEEFFVEPPTEDVHSLMDDIIHYSFWDERKVNAYDNIVIRES